MPFALKSYTTKPYAVMAEKNTIKNVEEPAKNKLFRRPISGSYTMAYRSLFSNSLILRIKELPGMRDTPSVVIWVTFRVELMIRMYSGSRQITVNKSSTITMIADLIRVFLV